MEKKKITYDLSNLIRVIAFICVFVLHATIFSVGDWKEKSIAYIVTTPAWAGVWIFFILSGYGTSKSYINAKYGTSSSDIIKYYLIKYIKIAPIYNIYLLIVIPLFFKEILTPNIDFVNLKKLIFFNYAEEFGSLYFGAVWFLSSLMKLYFITPFIQIIAQKLNLKNKKKIICYMFVILSIGFLCRILGYYSVRFHGTSWSPAIYKPFYMNIDLYIIGFLAGYVEQEDVKHKKSKFTSFLFAFFLIIVCINSYLNYLANFAKIPIAKETREFSMFIYQYICPTIYALILFGILGNKHIFELKNCKFTRILNDLTNFYLRRSLHLYLIHSNVFLIINMFIQKFYLNEALVRPFMFCLLLILVSIPLTAFIADLFYKLTNYLMSDMLKMVKQISIKIYLKKD